MSGRVGRIMKDNIRELSSVKPKRESIDRLLSHETNKMLNGAAKSLSKGFEKSAKSHYSAKLAKASEGVFHRVKGLFSSGKAEITSYGNELNYKSANESQIAQFLQKTRRADGVPGRGLTMATIIADTQGKSYKTFHKLYKASLQLKVYAGFSGVDNPEATEMLKATKQQIESTANYHQSKKLVQLLNDIEAQLSKKISS